MGSNGNHSTENDRCICVIWFVALVFFFLALAKIPALIERPAQPDD